MEYLAPDSPEKRALQDELLASIAAVATIEIEPPVEDYFAVYPGDAKLSPIEHMEVMHPSDPYEALAYRLHEEFKAKASTLKGRGEDYEDMAGNDAVIFGIDVLCTFLRYAPAAYLMYTGKEGVPVDMAEFEDAIRASTKVTSMFAATDRRTAATYETDFGVIAMKKPTYERQNEPAFRFERNRSGKLEFVKSISTELMSRYEVSGRLANGDLQELGAHRTCPAYYEVIDSLWQRGVTIAMEAPSLYPRDFALASTKAGG